MARTTIFPTQDVAVNTSLLGVYPAASINPAPFTLELGKTYAVQWGDTLFENLSVIDLADAGFTGGAIGNGAILDFPGNGEPFAIAYFSGDFPEIMILFLDSSESQTITVYLEDTGGGGEEETTTPIVLKDRTGTGIEYEGVEGVRVFDKAGNAHVFVPPVEREEKTVELDFSGGAMEVTPTAGKVLSKVDIPVPDGLMPENIPEGVRIAGIDGTRKTGAEGCVTVSFMNEDVKLFSRPVYIGDDCPNPLDQGHIKTTPTKVSDVQYDYTYAGWGDSNGGSVDTNILKNITEDKSVYAIYKSKLREYTITYLDSDGVTVLKTEQLPYGTVPSYVPTSSSGVFQEWIPAPTAVTGNASYKAVWSAAIVVIPQVAITVRTDGTSGVGTAGSATEGFVWGAKYRLTVDGETSEWVATQYYTTFADGNKFVTSGIGNPWARTNRNGSAVTAHRLNSHTGPTVSDTGEKFFVGISGPSTSGEYTASLYAKKAGTYTLSVVRIPD